MSSQNLLQGIAGLRWPAGINIHYGGAANTRVGEQLGSGGRGLVVDLPRHSRRDAWIGGIRYLPGHLDGGLRTPRQQIYAPHRGSIPPQ